MLVAVGVIVIALTSTHQGKGPVIVGLPDAPLATVDKPASAPLVPQIPAGMAEPGPPIIGDTPRYIPPPVDGVPTGSQAGGLSSDPDEVFAKCLDSEPLLFVVKGLWVWDQILGYLPCLHPGLSADEYIEMTAARLNVLRQSRPDVNWDEVQPGERYLLLRSALG